jgi:hypothetical protein
MSGGRIANKAAMAIAVAALVTTGCGDDSGPEKSQGRDLTALECPMVQTGDAQRYEPAENAFDTADLVGMKLAAARQKSAGHGCEIVVASEDGKGRPVPIEIDPTRIYVFVERGVVTYIEGVGGGI